MKLSTNFVKDYIDINDIDLKKIAEDMTRVGNEYDSAEKFLGGTNLIIGQVLTCENHPDSDHLHICTVNIGTEVLNIVCGAPNVRAGLKVIVAKVGAELPGDVTIKRGMIRGQESNGMMCSLAELGIDGKFLTQADKEGICELGDDAVVGEDPAKYLQMDDGVIDFELTANRGDLLSILGMAYELGAIYDKKVKPVELSHSESGEDINNNFKIDIKTENCKLFLAKKALNVTIKESPAFIKNRLMACGIRPINNVVDISNYVMLELGQPLHFYDADRLGNCLQVRMAENGEKLTTLDDTERTLDENDIVISNGEKAIGKPIGNYITLDIKNMKSIDDDTVDKISEVLATELKEIIAKHISDTEDILVVGLGNRFVTPDALGPKVIPEIEVTRHILKYMPELMPSDTRPVSAVSPGVLGITGIETLEILKGIVDNIKPKMLIVIDALATRSIERISSSIQLADTGIVPGAGVDNTRKEISVKTLNVPVIAVGIPTVVDLASITNDCINIFIENLQQKAMSNDALNKLKEQDNYEEIKQALVPKEYNMIVTPKEIDELIENMSKVVSQGINKSL